MPIAEEDPNLQHPDTGYGEPDPLRGLGYGQEEVEPLGTPEEYDLNRLPQPSFENVQPLVKPIPEPPKIQPVAPLGAELNASKPAGDRTFVDTQNALAPDAAKLPGAKGGVGAIAGAVTGKIGNIPKNSDDLVQMAGQKLLGNAANSKAGQAAISLANDAKNVAKLVETGGLDVTAWIALIRKYWKVIVAAILVVELPLVIVAIAIALSLTKLGNQPTSVAVAANSTYANSHCAQMEPTLDWKMPDGTTAHLTLYATEGEFSEEKSYDDESSSSGISLSSDITSTDSSSPYYFPDAWKPYYASGRFGYVASQFPYKASLTVFPGLASPKAYAGRRVIFYNPANGKAAVGIAMDWGPNPDVLQDRSNSNLEKQKELWDGAGSRNGYRITNPPGDSQSLVGGGPSTLAAELGASEYTPVEMGFATDQTLDPTKPFTCTTVSTTLASSSTSNLSNLASQIVTIANEQLEPPAKVEDPPGSNKGPNIDQYMTDIGRPIGEQWCADFAVWVYRKAGSSIPVNPSAEGLGNYFESSGHSSATPLPGDVAVFSSTESNSGYHVGIVTAVNSDGSFTTVEGNAGTGGAVKQEQYAKGGALYFGVPFQ